MGDQRVSLNSFISPLSEIALKSETEDAKPRESAHPIHSIKLPSKKDRAQGKPEEAISIGLAGGTLAEPVSKRLKRQVAVK